MINELIREYLVFNNYRNTLSVMMPGSYALHPSAYSSPISDTGLPFIPESIETGLDKKRRLRTRTELVSGILN